MPRDLSQRFKCPARSHQQAELFRPLQTLMRELAESIDELCPESEEKERSLAALDVAFLWGVAAIERHGVRDD